MVQRCESRDFLRRASCLISSTVAYIEIKAAEISAGARSASLKIATKDLARALSPLSFSLFLSRATAIVRVCISQQEQSAWTKRKVYGCVGGERNAARRGEKTREGRREGKAVTGKRSITFH